MQQEIRTAKCMKLGQKGNKNEKCNKSKRKTFKTK
jgi:hypothetical protein